jgi:signal peptidase I
MDLSHISQVLADVPVSDITVFALIFTFFRLILIRIPTAGARAFAEIVEAALIAAVLVFMIVQPFAMKSFYIPSGSMLPTLIDDDHIVVNKLEYRVEQPRDGDVIVFVAPERALDQAPEGNDDDSGPTNYIKRLIGSPGDVIQVHHGYVTIGGAQQTHADIRRAFNLDDHDRQHVLIESNDVAIFDGGWVRYSAAQIARQFSMPNATVTFHPGVTTRNGEALDEPYVAEDPDYDLRLFEGHSVLFDPDGSGYLVDGNAPSVQQYDAFKDAPPGPVPPGFVFVMGDNRNDSNDSTRWGPLEMNRIVGKAGFIFWPIDRIREIR